MRALRASGDLHGALDAASHLRELRPKSVDVAELHAEVVDAIARARLANVAAVSHMEPFAVPSPVKLK
jgi:hypothetical protein